MKTSNKFLIAILLTLVISNIVYAIAMKREYLTGHYKDPYFNFTTLPYHGFNEVVINPSENVNVKLVQGPFKVMVNNMPKDNLLFKQTGNTLHVDLNWGYARFNTGDDYMVLISCPNLKAVHVNATYTLNKVNYTDTTVIGGWAGHHVLIDGFKQDSLAITQQWGSEVILNNNSLGYLKTATSINDNSVSKLTLLKTNNIQHTNFDIRNKGQLILSEAKITNLHYQLADSALLIMNGAAIRSIKK